MQPTLRGSLNAISNHNRNRRGKQQATFALLRCCPLSSLDVVAYPDFSQPFLFKNARRNAAALTFSAFRV